MRNGLIVDKRGTRCWYRNDQFHRDDGPAVEWRDGHREWYVNGEWHREDGPAIEYANGNRRWLVNGQSHRTDGPAVQRVDGSREWWLNGECYTFGEWLEKNTELTPQQKTILMLKYGDQ